MNLSAIKKVTAVHNDILKTKVVLYDSSLDSFKKDLVFEDTPLKSNELRSDEIENYIIELENIQALTILELSTNYFY